MLRSRGLVAEETPGAVLEPAAVGEAGVAGGALEGAGEAVQVVTAGEGGGAGVLGGGPASVEGGDGGVVVIDGGEAVEDEGGGGGEVGVAELDVVIAPRKEG